VSAAELIDIVDANDRVIGQCPRAEINERRLRHRVVHVLLYAPDGQLILQKRSAQRSFLPLHWTTSAGGHVSSGETYIEAAERELEEELGIQTPLTFLRWYVYKVPEADNFFKHTALFRGVSEGPFRLRPEVVERVEFFEPDALASFLETAPVHAELAYALRRTASKQATS
jgi:isopentenyldiphosphate isomerase